MGSIGSSRRLDLHILCGGIRRPFQASLDYIMQGIAIGGEDFLEVFKLGLHVAGVALHSWLCVLSI